MKNRYKIFLYSFLIVLLILVLYIRCNSDKIFEAVGNYYLNHNNTEQALNFYDRAFAYGDKTNYKLREKYVNTIINSPMSIKSQERLVSVVEGKIKDSAYYNAVYYLYNLKKEVHYKYHYNYISYAPINNQIVHWGRMPITYSFKNQQKIHDDIIKSVNDAFNEIERATSCRIKFKLVKINPDIWIEFMQESVQNPEFGRKYIIAYTTPVISQKVLENMVVKLNLISIEGQPYTPNQIYNTSLHEIIHALGILGHSPDERNVMHMTRDAEIAEADKRVFLTEPDKLTLELLYKIKPDITNAEELEYKYVPNVVLGEDENINYSKMREAKNYIKKAPTLPNGYIDMAGVLAEQKQYKKAEECLERALRLAKNADSKYIVNYNLAIISYRQDLFDLAFDYVNTAIEIKDTEEAHFLKAEILAKKKDVKNAVKEYEYLISLYPQKIDYPIFLANLYIQKRNFLKARSVLKRYIQKNPSEKNNPKFNAYRKLFL